MPVQQRRAALLFELSDLAPQRGLGDANDRGGLGEAAVLGDLDEKIDAPEVHGKSRG